MITLDQFVEHNFSLIDFKDKRLSRRCEMIISTFSKRDMTKSFPELFSDRHCLKSFYRFMNNKKVNRELFLQNFSDYLKTAYRQRPADDDGDWYLVQDTLYTDFNSRESLEGSYTQSVKNKGFILHHGLMLNSRFIPQGLLFQDVINRDREQFGKSHDKASRPIEDKESYKWINGLQAGARFTESCAASIVHIMDREGDILDVIKEAERLKARYVIRSTHNRNLPQENSKLWNTLRDLPQGSTIVRILRDKGGRTYQANCILKYRQVTINGFSKPIFAVYLKEVSPIHHQRKRKEDVEWLLLTNLDVTDYGNAEHIVNIYAHRWLVEEFHHCLQTGGCEIEKRQFRNDDVLLDTITLLSIPALKILLSRYLARENPEEEMQMMFSDIEIEFAEKIAPRYLKPSDHQDARPRSVLWIIILLSRMGGHQGIRARGLPGYRTLWRGWAKFDQQLQGYLIAKDP